VATPAMPATRVQAETARPSRRKTLRDASWRSELEWTLERSNTMVLLVVVLLLTLTLVGCGSHTARLEQVDDENCRRIVAERDRKDHIRFARHF
jgi:hypothetical protein